jgi:hypothetical protein
LPFGSANDDRGKRVICDLATQSKEGKKEDVRKSIQILGCLDHSNNMVKIDVGLKRPS